jgi:hypothetical protein
MNILTAYTHPPIPDRRFDWAAWVKGEEETLSARGPTEQEAIDALQKLIEERHE